MRNIEKWVPSKFVYKGNRLVASRDPREVGVASRLMCDRIAASYDKYIRLYARGRLVDLGCGKVPLFATYKPYVNTNTCVDWGAGSHGSEYLDLLCDLTSTLPFADGQFDTVILSDVLEHLPEPEKIWTEMGRILSDNGRILLSVPFYYWLHEQPHDYYRYSEHALVRFANVTGFKVIVLDRLGGVPEILTDIVAKTILSFPKLGKILSATVQQFASLLLKTAFVNGLSEATSTGFPLGYFLVAEKNGQKRA